MLSIKITLFIALTNFSTPPLHCRLVTGPPHLLSPEHEHDPHMALFGNPRETPITKQLSLFKVQDTISQFTGPLSRPQVFTLSGNCHSSRVHRRDALDQIPHSWNTTANNDVAIMISFWPCIGDFKD